MEPGRIMLAVLLVVTASASAASEPDAEALAELDRRLTQMERPARRAEVERMMADPDEATRVLNLLTRSLASDDGRQSRRAARAVCVFEEKGAPLIPVLVRCLVKSPSSPPGDDCRHDATSALGHIGHASIPALIELMGHEDLAHRQAAARTLAAIARGWTWVDTASWTPPRGEAWDLAIPVLLGALDDSDVAMRSWTAETLGRIRPRVAAAVPALLRRLADEATEVRRASARSLGWIGDCRAVTALRRIVSAPDDLARLEAAVALARIDAEDPLPIRALLESLESRPGPAGTIARRREAMSSIASLGRRARSALPAVLRVLRKESPAGRITDVRRAAVTAVTAISEVDDDIIDALVGCLGDHEIEFMVQHELIRIGRPAVPALSRAMVRKWSGRENAAEVLRQINRFGAKR